MTSSVLKEALQLGLVQRSSHGLPKRAAKRPDSKVGVARRHLRELEQKGCDRDLILGITYLLAFGRRPEERKVRRKRKDFASGIVRSLHQVTLRVRHQAAFHAATTYDQRDWWLLQNLPDLLEEYQITIKKVSTALRSEPRYLRRDFWLIWLAEHLKERTGRPAWEPIAAIIEAWQGELQHLAVDASSLERSYLIACRTGIPGVAGTADSVSS